MESRSPHGATKDCDDAKKRRTVNTMLSTQTPQLSVFFKPQVQFVDLSFTSTRTVQVQMYKLHTSFENTRHVDVV